jgi:hypothetical protein
MLNYERMEMGNPRCIAPLIVAGVIAAIGSITSAAMSSSATNKANAANSAAAANANAITNQQWASEMKLKRKELDQQAIGKLQDWINQEPSRQKNFIDIWSGGR